MSARRHAPLGCKLRQSLQRLKILVELAAQRLRYGIHDIFVGIGSKDRIHLRNLLADLFLVALRQASGHDQRL